MIESTVCATLQGHTVVFTDSLCQSLVKKIPLMLMGNIRRKALDLCALLAGNRHIPFFNLFLP